MIRTAYGVDADTIYGGPNWLDYDRYEVIAKAKAGTKQVPLPVGIGLVSSSDPSKVRTVR